MGWKRPSRVILSNPCNEGCLPLHQAEDHSVRSLDFHPELPTSPCSCGAANVNKLRNCSCRENSGKLQVYLNQKPDKTPEKCTHTSARRADSPLTTLKNSVFCLLPVTLTGYVTVLRGKTGNFKPSRGLSLLISFCKILLL